MRNEADLNGRRLLPVFLNFLLLASSLGAPQTTKEPSVRFEDILLVPAGPVPPIGRLLGYALPTPWNSDKIAIQPRRVRGTGSFSNIITTSLTAGGACQERV